jgi:hypothetical protein
VKDIKALPRRDLMEFNGQIILFIVFMIILTTSGKSEHAKAGGRKTSRPKGKTSNAMGITRKDHWEFGISVKTVVLKQ